MPNGNDKAVAATILGGVIGFFTGGASFAVQGIWQSIAVGAQIGYTLGSAYAQKGQTFNTPAIDNFDGDTTGSYGANLERGYGKNRRTGNVIWYQNGKPLPVQKSESFDNPGPKWLSGSSINQYYVYFGTFALAIGEPISGIKRIWADDILIFDAESFQNPILDFVQDLQVYQGYSDQVPSTAIVDAEGAGEYVAYRGTAYLLFDRLNLSPFFNRLPKQFVVEAYDEDVGDFNNDPTLMDLLIDNVDYLSVPFYTIVNDYQQPWLHFGTIAISLHYQYPWYTPIDLTYNVYTDLGGIYPEPVLFPYTVENYAPFIVCYSTLDNITGYVFQTLQLFIKNPAYFPSSGGKYNLSADSPVFLRVYPIANSGWLFVTFIDASAKQRVFIGEIVDNNMISFEPVPTFDQSTVSFPNNNELYIRPKLARVDDDWIIFVPNCYQNSAYFTMGIRGKILPFGSGLDNSTWVSVKFSQPSATVQYGIAPVKNTQAGWIDGSLITASTTLGVVVDQVNDRVYKMIQSVSIVDAFTFQSSIYDSGAYLDLTNPVRLGSDPIVPRPSVDEDIVFAVQRGDTVGIDVYSFFTSSQITGPSEGAAIATETPLKAIRVDTYKTWAVAGKGIYYSGESNDVTGSIYSFGELSVSGTLDDDSFISGVYKQEMSRIPYLDIRDLDFTGINTDTINGYTINTNPSAAEALQPIRETYFVDVIEEDYQLKFQSRSSLSSVKTIPTSDLRAAEEGSEQPDSFVRTIKLDKTIPGKVLLTYKDLGRDYEENTQIVERTGSKAAGVQDISTPLIMSANGAAQAAERILRSSEQEAKNILEFVTHWEHSDLEENQLLTIVDRQLSGYTVEGDAGYSDVTLRLTLDDTLVDASSYARTATLTGGSYITGVYGNARHFTSNAQLRYPTSSDNERFLSGPYTVEMWFRRQNDVGATLWGNSHASITCYNPTGVIVANVISGTGITSTTTMYDNNWHHIALVRESTAAGDLHLYIDGVEEGTPGQDSRNHNGAYPDDFMPYVSPLLNNCDLDDVRLSKVARYTTGFTPTGPLESVGFTGATPSYTDTTLFTVRLLTVDKGRPGLVKLSAVIEKTSNYVSTATGETGTYTPDGYTPIAISAFLVIDSVAISAADLNYGWYYVAYPTSTSYSWNGAEVLQNTSGSTWEVIDSVFAAPAVCTCVDSLSSTALYTLIDYSDTLEVSLISGSLTSVTEAQMLNGSNICFYGAEGRWEIIKFQNRTDNGNNNYTLDTFIRGYHGTQHLIDSHQDGDYLIVYTTASTPHLLNTDSDTVGTVDYFAGVSIGYDFSPGTPTTQAYYTGNSVLPLAGVDGYAWIDSSSDIQISWLRSSIKFNVMGDADTDTDILDGIDFEIDVLDPIAETVVRTIETTISTTGLKTATYTAAQQTTDFGAPIADNEIYLAVYELHEVLGRGLALYIDNR